MNIKNPELTFPTELARNDFFKCPVWNVDAPQFVDDLNSASDKYIQTAKDNLKEGIDKRNKDFGDKGDMGHVFHSSPLIGDPDFKDLTHYIAKNGGGYHTLHTHWNGHMSGFYFLKASEKTSRPLFEDPRAGNMMNLLPQKKPHRVTYASSQINYDVKPGTMIFFPSYLPHQYMVDMGYDPFRFIHWNCQAIPKGVLNVKPKPKGILNVQEK